MRDIRAFTVIEMSIIDQDENQEQSARIFVFSISNFMFEFFFCFFFRSPLTIESAFTLSHTALSGFVAVYSVFGVHLLFYSILLFYLFKFLYIVRARCVACVCWCSAFFAHPPSLSISGEMTRHTNCKQLTRKNRSSFEFDHSHTQNSNNNNNHGHKYERFIRLSTTF